MSDTDFVTLCGACGNFYETDETDSDGFHKANLCDAYEEAE